MLCCFHTIFVLLLFGFLFVRVLLLFLVCLSVISVCRVVFLSVMFFLLYFSFSVIFFLFVLFFLYTFPHVILSCFLFLSFFSCLSFLSVFPPFFLFPVHPSITLGADVVWVEDEFVKVKRGDNRGLPTVSDYLQGDYSLQCELLLSLTL